MSKHKLELTGELYVECNYCHADISKDIQKLLAKQREEIIEESEKMKEPFIKHPMHDINCHCPRCLPPLRNEGIDQAIKTINNTH